MKRAVALLAVLAGLACLAAAQAFTVAIDGEQLHIRSTRIHFLTGEALQRLHDGATVNYEFQLTAGTDRAGKLLARAVERFAVSYDLWEEKFAITKLTGAPKSISQASAAAAEAWCLDNTTLPVGVLPATQPFWVRLDYRAEDSGAALDPDENSSFTLSVLVDIFSRRARREQVHGSEEIGPLRLPDLRKK